MQHYCEYSNQRRCHPGVVVPAVERQQGSEDNLLAETLARVAAFLGRDADCFGAGGGMAAPALFCLEGGPWSAFARDGVSWRPSGLWRGGPGPPPSLPPPPPPPKAPPPPPARGGRFCPPP